MKIFKLLIIKKQRQIAPPYHPRPAGGQAGAKKLIPPNYDQLKESLKENFEKLKVSWETMDIPIHHREIFIKCCKQISRERAVELIIAEIEDLKKGDSFVQNCMKAVKGREQCLLQIEDQIIFMAKNSNSNSEEVLNKCSELITHLRLLSINAVECIVAWRNYLMEFLNSANKERQVMIIPYLFKEQNYLIKMRNDSHFLRNSILKDFFFFSNRAEFKIDPFILSVTDTNEQTEKQVQFISKNLRKRIENCIHLLSEEHTRVIEDEKFQQMNSKKPSYNIYQQKFQGVAPIRKSSQNSRIASKQINQEKNNYQMYQGSGRKDHHSPNSSINSKQSPQKQLNFDGSPSGQRKDGDDAWRSNQNSQNNVPSQSEFADISRVPTSQQENKGQQNENINRNQQRNSQQNLQQQKSTQSIYQQIKGQNNTGQQISKDLSASKSQPNHQVQQQNKQENIQQKQQTQPSQSNKDSQVQQTQSQNTVHQQKPEEKEQKAQQQQVQENRQSQQIEGQVHVQDQHEAEKKQNIQNKDKEEKQNQNQTPQEDDDSDEGAIEVPDYVEEDLIKYTDEYLKSVEQKIKESVLSSTQEIQKRIRTEYESGCLTYKNQGKLKGIAYYFNESSQQSRRITLMHVSAINQKCLDQFLNQIITYIFTNDSCDEIRFCIYHHENEEGNMQVHKDIQTIFTSKGFKWKQVNNDKYTHQRTTILALRRPANIPQTLKLKQFDHIVVESVAIIQNATTASPQTNQMSVNYDMTTNLLGSFDQVISEDPKFATLLSNSDNKVFQKSLDQINVLMRKNYKYSDMKKEQFDNSNKLSEALIQYEINYNTQELVPDVKINLKMHIKNILKSQIQILFQIKILIDILNNHLQNKIYSSLSKLALKWRSFSQCVIDNNQYLRPQNDDDHNYMIANSKINKKVFILPTDDENTNIFLFEIDNKEEFLQDFQQNVKDVMKSLKDTQQMKEDLFIPTFEFTQKSNCNIKKEDGSGYTLSQQLYISINYQTSLPKINIKIQKQSTNQIVIKPPFVFGNYFLSIERFINNDIDEILEIPYYSSLIEQTNCIKSQK